MGYSVSTRKLPNGAQRTIDNTPVVCISSPNYRNSGMPYFLASLRNIPLREAYTAAFGTWQIEINNFSLKVHLFMHDDVNMQATTLRNKLINIMHIA